MSKKAAKSKRTKSKSKKRKRSVALTWLKVVIVLIILMSGFAYIVVRTGRFSLSKDFLRDLLAKREIEVDLYFSDPLSDHLVPERRIIPKSFSQQQKITNTIQELIKGPKGKLVHTIPTSTRLVSVHIDRYGVVWLDFSSNLSRDHPGGSSAEIATVYSIVNTVLLNFKQLAKVRILIDGVEIETLAGHIDCSKPLLADKDLIK